MSAAGGARARPPPANSGETMGALNTSARNAAQRPTFHQMTADYITNILSGATSDIPPENKGSTILVTDAYTLKILTYALSMGDIYQAGFMVVDKFETKKEAEKNLTRRPYYPLDVLYYIRGNEWNLKRVLSDYELPYIPLGEDCFERCFPWLFPKEEESSMPKPLYGECRLLTVAGHQSQDSSPNWEKVRAYLRQWAEQEPRYSSFLKYFRDDSAIKDCIVEYYALDTNLFSLGLPDTFSTLYEHKMLSITQNPDAWKQVQNTLDAIAYRVASALIVMNEKPYIRFSERSEDAGGRRRGYTSMMATFLEDHLMKYHQAHTSWTPTGHKQHPTKDEDPSEPGTVFIVDRVDDVASAILHDFTYESAIIDLLGHEPGSLFCLETKQSDGRTTTISCNLDDKDPLFASLRHKNIYEAFGMLRDLSKKIKSQQQDLMSNDDPRALRQMLQMALKRGTKGDIQEKVDIHTDIALSIQKKLSDELAEAYNVEQILVTGVGNDGETYNHKKIRSEVFSQLRSTQLTNEMKLRLIILYLLHAPSVDANTRNSLIEEANLDKDLKNAFYNLNDIDIPHIRESFKPVSWSAPRFDIENAKKVARNRTDEEKGRGVSRYTPRAVDIISSHLNGDLSRELFPYIRPPPDDASTKTNQRNTAPVTRRESKLGGNWKQEPPKGVGESKRSAKPSRFLDMHSTPDGTPGNGKVSTPEDEPLLDQERHVQGPRTIFFVLGGITPLEISALENLARKTNREIIYGSTSIMSASDIIEQLTLTNVEEDEDFPQVKAEEV